MDSLTLYRKVNDLNPLFISVFRVFFLKKPLLSYVSNDMLINVRQNRSS